MSDTDWQPAAPYPPGFILAVKPGEVNANQCDHEADPPVCKCAHDWRIEWSNVARKSRGQATYVTDSP